MKPKIYCPIKGRLKLCIIFLFYVFLLPACQKDELEYADENLEISSSPGISIYKTKGNYIDYIQFQLLEGGEINAIPGLSLTSPLVQVDDRGNIKQNFRWRLKSGYIVSKNEYVDNVYTDITIQEYIEFESDTDEAGWPSELLKSRIIDSDPFLEYYHFSGLNKPERYFTLGELNSLIENGQIETIFEKLK